MRKIITAFFMVALSVAASTAFPGAKVGAFFDDNTPLDYERYKDYFVRNDAGVPDGASFHMFIEMEKFDKVFKGVPGGGKTFLPDDVFETRFVVAVVQQGRFITNYMVTNVARQKDKLRIYYEATKKPTPTSTQRSPLILAIDKADFDYSEIIFTENGKDVFKVNLKD